MKNKTNKGFTLVELVAVLVIMAVIALIATPLILNLINKAKASANKRSVDAYGKAVELSVLSYLMDNGSYPTDLSTLTVEYTGKEVACNVMSLNTDGSIYLSECSVGNTEVRDDSTEDGWYHYGTLESETYVAYNVGDQITYNGIDFYVIENSDETKDSVTLLKAEPLTVDEVNTYGVGHINNYIYISSTSGTAYDFNGYGGMAYYSSATCGYDGSTWVYDGCTTDYASSEIKYVVDGWSADKLNLADLKEDQLGYKTRLLTLADLTTNLGYDISQQPSDMGYIYPSDNTPSWLYTSDNYWATAWTMTQFLDRQDAVWMIYYNGQIGYWVASGYEIIEPMNVIRPVITLLKSAI